MPATDHSHPRRPQVLRANSAFARLWTATLISGIGSLTTFIALPLVAYERTGSASTFAMIMAASTIGTLVMTLVGGAFADRWDRRRLLIVGDVLLLVGIIGMAAAVHLDAWHACAVVALLSSATTAAFRAASPALLRDIVTDDERVAANALTQFSYSASSLVGPLLGAGLYPLIGFTALAAVDAVSFVVSIVLIVGLHDPTAAHRAARAAVESTSATPRRVLREVREGVSLGLSDPYTRPEILAAMASGVANGGFIIAIVPWLDRAMGLPSTAFGLLVAVVGLAGIAASIVVSRLGESVRPETLMVVGAGCGVVGSLAFLTAPPVWLLGLSLLGFGVANVVSSVGASTLTQRRFPSEFQGRLGSLHQLGFQGCSLIGTMAAAWLAVRAGVQAPVTAFALLIIVAQGFFLLALRGSRKPVSARIRVALEEEQCSGPLAEVDLPEPTGRSLGAVRRTRCQRMSSAFAPAITAAAPAATASPVVTNASARPPSGPRAAPNASP